MAKLKLVGFSGVAPRISPELLQDNYAQRASNCKLYSGDIIPYRRPLEFLTTVTVSWGSFQLLWGSQPIAWTDYTGKDIFPLKNPVTGATEILIFSGRVDVVSAFKEFLDEQRFYFTDGVQPKVSNYELGVDGGYNLGLPLPTKIPNTSFTAFTPKAITNLERDSSGIVRATCANHGIRDGSTITVSKATFRTATYVASASSDLTGTYSQAAQSLTIQINIDNHGLVTGSIVRIEFGGHTDINGSYAVSTTSPDIFFVVVGSASARSGTATVKEPPATTVTITLNNHQIANGSEVVLDFVSGNVPDGTYTVSNSQANTFDVTLPTPLSVSGNVRIDTRNFNVVNAVTTILDDNTFTYFSPGFTTKAALGTGLDTVVDIGGLTQARTYTYTWYTPWDEESIASEPSIERFSKEGVVYTISNLPTPAELPANTFVRGIRLYRTLPSLSGTDFFRLRTLWYPNSLRRVARASNISTVRFLHPHNFGIGDRFKISGATGSGSTFNITGGIVDDIIDEYTFEYVQVAANVNPTNVTTGTLFQDVAETVNGTARYWGDGGNYNFTDDFNSRNLTDVLETDNYDPPPRNLTGLVSIQNDILCGFVGNTLYFSEPGRPHAWPFEYSTSIDAKIVGLAPIAGSTLVLTESFPYVLAGSDPANGMQASRIDVDMPCVSKKSIVPMPFGIVYATYDGLGVYAPSMGGIDLLTRAIFERDTWLENVDPKTIVAEYYADTYVATYAGPTPGGFIYKYDRETGGFFTEFDFGVFASTCYDSVNGTMFYADLTTNLVYKWDSDAVADYTWKSKVFVVAAPVNFGVCKIEADFVSGFGVEFKLFINKSSTAILTHTTFDNKPFRLPTGYRADTFEVQVSGKIRVRSIHLSETAIGLREI